VSKLIRHLERFNKIREKLDVPVWTVFNRYISDFKINFNGPESWSFEGSSIFFTGRDGCRGCYDSMSLDIPIEFFENYELARGKTVAELKAKKDLKIAVEAERISRKERALYATLKAKFEGGDE
jgi:hypothetical protein